MAFDWQAAARASGVDPEWYETPEQLAEDMQLRAKDDKAFRQKIWTTRQMMNRESQPPMATPPPAAPQATHTAGSFSMPIGQSSPTNLFGTPSLDQMGDEVEAAFRAEHASRLRQIANQQDRAHELEILRMQMEARKKSDEAALIRQLLSR